jgi:hypothetical protein
MLRHGKILAKCMPLKPIVRQIKPARGVPARNTVSQRAAQQKRSEAASRGLGGWITQAKPLPRDLTRRHRGRVEPDFREQTTDSLNPHGGCAGALIGNNRHVELRVPEMVGVTEASDGIRVDAIVREKAQRLLVPASA